MTWSTNKIERRRQLIERKYKWKIYLDQMLLLHFHQQHRATDWLRRSCRKGRDRKSKNRMQHKQKEFECNLHMKRLLSFCQTNKNLSTTERFARYHRKILKRVSIEAKIPQQWKFENKWFQNKWTSNTKRSGTNRSDLARRSRLLKLSSFRI
jgi:hypothetical protein